MISVCIATYNGETYLREQLDSILPQLDKDDEVIISDDGSTDSTIHLISGLGDCRIRVVQNEGKKGCIHNFENALKHAKGDYIFLSDQDDIWAPNKVQKFMQALAVSDCVVSDASVVDTNKNVIEESFYKCNNNHKGKLYNLLVSNNYLGCCMAFHKRILTKAFPFPKSILKIEVLFMFLLSVSFRYSSNLCLLHYSHSLFRFLIFISSHTTTEISGTKIQKPVNIIYVRSIRLLSSNQIQSIQYLHQLKKL